MSSPLPVICTPADTVYLSPAARIATINQMFVITNLVKDTLPRADVDERHVNFLYAFHAKQLVLFKIILESY